MGNKDKGGRNTKKAATRSLKQKRTEKKAKREALKGSGARAPSSQALQVSAQPVAICDPRQPVSS